MVMYDCSVDEMRQLRVDRDAHSAVIMSADEAMYHITPLTNSAQSSPNVAASRCAEFPWQPLLEALTALQMIRHHMECNVTYLVARDQQ